MNTMTRYIWDAFKDPLRNTHLARHLHREMHHPPPHLPHPPDLLPTPPTSCDPFPRSSHPIPSSRTKIFIGVGFRIVRIYEGRACYATGLEWH